MIVEVKSKHEIIGRGTIWSIKLSENPEIALLMKEGTSLINVIVKEKGDKDSYQIQGVESTLPGVAISIGLLVKKIT